MHFQSFPTQFTIPKKSQHCGHICHVSIYLYKARHQLELEITPNKMILKSEK